MEPTVPTSFIPKRPIDSGSMTTVHHSRAIGLVSLLTVVIVIATGVAFGGVYVYEKRLVGEKKKLEVLIAQSRDAIGTDFVADMRRLDTRIDGVKELIKNHIVVSPVFEALEASTLRTIQYEDFSYSFQPDLINKTTVVVVEITGIAKNYATIALQSDAFSSNALIKNPVFSNLTVDEKSGAINFKLVFSVSPTDLSYQRFVDNMIKKQNQTPVVIPNPLTP